MPGGVFVAATFACALALAGCQGRDTRLSAHLQRGQQYLADGDLLRAQTEFREATQVAPYSATARYLGGRVAELLGETRDADELYLSSIELAPDFMPAYESLARSYVTAGTPDRALELLGPVLLQHPDDADLLVASGMARAQLHDRQGALADATRALKLAPRNENAILLRGSLLQQDGQGAAAAAVLAAALQNDPRSVDLHLALAEMYLQLERPDRALAQLAATAALQPHQLAQRYRLSQLYVRAGRLDEAERVLKESVATAADNDAPKLAYVEFLFQYRGAVQAQQVLEQFVNASPTDGDLQLERALLQQRSGRIAAALSTYAALAAGGDGPGTLTARKRMAALLADRGQLVAAADQIRQVLRSAPHDDEALQLRAEIELASYDPAAALADLGIVLADRPGFTPALQLLGRARLADGDATGAVQALRSALDATPDDVALRVELARLLEQTHDVAAALELLQQAVKIAPTDPATREALVRAELLAPDPAAASRTVGEFRALPLPVAAGHASEAQATAAYLDGLIAQAQRQYPRAERAYEQALRLDPTAMPALTALVQVEVLGRRPAQALASARAVVQAQPTNAGARNLVGELDLAGRNYRDAAAQLQQAIMLAPLWWEPYRNLALTQSAAGEPAMAIATLAHGVQAAGPQPALVSQLAGLYESQGRPGEAIELYEAYHRRTPGNLGVAANLALLLVTYRADRASLDEAGDLTAPFLASGDAHLIDTAGWVQLKLGETARALPELQRAAQMLPQSNVVHYHLGMAELRAGHRDQARTELLEALDGAASFVGISEARATLTAIQAAGQ